MKLIKIMLPVIALWAVGTAWANDDKTNNLDDENRNYYDACVNNNKASACRELAYLLLGRGGEANAPKVVTYIEKACNLNDAESCNNIGFLYMTGNIVKQDYIKANTYYEKACNLNDGNGCHNLGYLYDSGIGVKQDYKKASTYYEKACKLNNGGSCHNLGVLYAKGRGVVQSKTKAREYYRKACYLGERLGQPGCDNVYESESDFALKE